MRTRRAKAVGVALVTFACGCSGAHQYAAPGATTTPTAVVIRPTRSSTTTTSAPDTTTTAPSSTVATTTTSAATTTTTAPVTQPTAPLTGLASLILDTVPSGYVRLADDVGQTGPTNIAQAADADDSGNARRALLVTGFVTGYQRQWTSSPDGYTIDQIFLYEFQTPKGAQGYAQHWRDTLVQTNSGSPLQSFTPAFIPGAFGLQTKGKTGSTAVVMFSKGIYAVEATVNGGVLSPGDPPADQSGPSTALGFAQYQRLP